MAPLIDAIASAPWYGEHLRPILDALGDDVGGALEGRSILRPLRHPAPAVLVASYGDLIIARKLGYRRFILAQHGSGQSYGAARVTDYPSYPGGRNHADVGLFLAPNEHAGARWRAAYPRAAVRVVGCPKLDTLPRREPGPGPVVAVSWHWNFSLCPETRSAFVEYAAALPPLARRFTVIGHGHPKRADLRRFYGRIGVEFVPEFRDVCRRADVYVVDNSSTLFEFAATGRPVVVVNARDFRRDANHGLRFWSAATVGVQANRPPELAAAVERALECRPEDVAAREAALDLVYQPRSGSALLAAEAIREYLATPIRTANRPIDRRRARSLASR